MLDTYLELVFRFSSSLSEAIEGHIAFGEDLNQLKVCVGLKYMLNMVLEASLPWLTNLRMDPGL